MVFNLDPLKITLDFERRKYRLGDTINATVTLIPGSDVEIRTASLNLIGQVRRTEVKMGRTMGAGGASALQGGVPLRTNDYVPMQQHTDQKITTEIFYSTAIFLSRSLRKGDVSKQKVALILDPQLRKLQEMAFEAKELQRDANQGLSIEPWWLEARVDVVMGRDAIVRRRIEIIAPLKTTA